MPRNRKQNSGGEEGAPGWVVTYGDMMSLLLTFFIFLFAFSTINAQEFKEVMEALKTQLGVLHGGKTLVNGPAAMAGDVTENFSNVEDEAEFQELIEQVRQHVKEENLEGDVLLQSDQRGLIIRFTGQVLYDLGKANLKPEGASVLKTIAYFLQGIPNHIAIEGHTDNLPINTAEFKDNWDLSTARANGVIRFFLDNTKIAPTRIAASGYGEFQPLVDNNTEANRAKNRRVDVVILKTRSDNAQ